jgi:predicted ABC-class ATPase
MKQLDELKRILRKIDGKGYKAYKDIEGGYYNKKWFLFIDHVQGDPFAPASKIRIRVPLEKTRFPTELFNNKIRKIAFEDFVSRRASRIISSIKRVKGTGKSGLIHIDTGLQEVIERTSCKVTDQWIELRLYVGLPAQGRKILAQEAERMFFEQIPKIKEEALTWDRYNKDDTYAFIACIENQEYIRDRLKEKGIVAFVADGSILPRKSGNTQLPMEKRKAVPFRSPDSLKIVFKLLHPVNGKKELSGMGIPEGVTLIVGGGYHGKSTLIQAIERGVYPHIPGDGREYVITISSAVKIRAEDGRRVENVDISAFINNLPGGISTNPFSTENASGSTSQATNIVEAIEMGAELLLLDEDTSATNFMIRDVRMQALVSKEHEPITPFIDRVQELYKKLNISTILVMGGCGDYFDVADTVIMMQDYLPYDVTNEAKEVALRYRNYRIKEVEDFTNWNRSRIPIKESFKAYKKGKIKIEAKDIDKILYGNETVDLRGIEQIVELNQTRAIGMAIYLASRFMNNKSTLREVLKKVDDYIDKEGLDVLDPFYKKEKHPGSFTRPRIFEIAAAINRLRSARLKLL